MRKAKLSKSGQSQAVRLPKGYQFNEDEVFIRKVGNAVILLPKDQPWKPLLDSLKLFSDDFLQERQQPQQQKRPGTFSIRPSP